MTAPMIVVQVNDSCGVYATYEAYPSYIPDDTDGEKPDNHQQKVSISYPACGIPGGTR